MSLDKQSKEVKLKRCDIEERFTLWEMFSDWRRVREIGYRFASRRYFFAVIMYFSQASTESRNSSLGSWGREQRDGGAERGFQVIFFSPSERKTLFDTFRFCLSAWYRSFLNSYEQSTNSSFGVTKKSGFVWNSPSKPWLCSIASVHCIGIR